MQVSTEETRTLLAPCAPTLKFSELCPTKATREGDFLNFQRVIFHASLKKPTRRRRS